MVIYANRDNSANYGSLLQIQRLMSNREMFGKAADLSVFAIPRGRSRRKQRPLSANIKLRCKKIHKVKQSALLNCHSLAHAQVS